MRVRAQPAALLPTVARVTQVVTLKKRTFCALTGLEVAMIARASGLPPVCLEGRMGQIPHRQEHTERQDQDQDAHGDHEQRFDGGT